MMTTLSKYDAQDNARQRAQELTRTASETVDHAGTNGPHGIFTPEPPKLFNPKDWEGPDGEIGRYIA